MKVKESKTMGNGTNGKPIDRTQCSVQLVTGSYKGLKTFRDRKMCLLSRKRTAQLKGMLSARRRTLRGLMGKSWEKGQVVAHCVGGRALNMKDVAGWLTGEENELIRVPGMESLLLRGWLSRTESAPSGV